MGRNEGGISLKRGQRIRELRVRAGLTLEEAAEKADMSIGQLSEVENGKRWHERWESLDRLAGALGVTASELVGA
jgi:transcriptional regulator with XRE-family HTH domain